jgi:hypothetical protein
VDHGTRESSIPYVCLFLVQETYDADSHDCTQYQLALHQIDSMRKDGKFIGADGSIPEGQAIVVAHLSECHELVEMVRLSDM